MRHAPAVLVLLAAVACGVSADEFSDDVRRLAPAIGLRPGQVVADIGAGSGQLTVALAAEVGPTGRVFSTEMTESRRGEIRQAAEKAGLSNVTVLEARDTATNLPAGCCDAIVIRNVYHHFAEPAPMNRSLMESLTPGGHVVVFDFEPRQGRTAAPADRDERGSHGVDAETVIAEMTAAGFERVSVTSGDERRSFMVVMRKRL